MARVDDDLDRFVDDREDHDKWSRGGDGYESGDYVPNRNPWVFMDAAGWAPLSNRVVREAWPGDGASAKLLWLNLLSHANGRPHWRVEKLSLDRLADQTGLNKSTVQKAVAYLEAVELVSIPERGDTKRGGRRRTHVYFVQPDVRKARWDRVPPKPDRKRGDHPPVYVGVNHTFLDATSVVEA